MKKLLVIKIKLEDNHEKIGYLVSRVETPKFQSDWECFLTVDPVKVRSLSDDNVFSMLQNLTQDHISLIKKLGVDVKEVEVDGKDLFEYSRVHNPNHNSDDWKWGWYLLIQMVMEMTYSKPEKSTFKVTISVDFN